MDIYFSESYTNQKGQVSAQYSCTWISLENFRKMVGKKSSEKISETEFHYVSSSFSPGFPFKAYTLEFVTTVIPICGTSGIRFCGFHSVRKGISFIYDVQKISAHYSCNFEQICVELLPQMLLPHVEIQTFFLIAWGHYVNMLENERLQITAYCFVQKCWGRSGLSQPITCTAKYEFYILSQFALNRPFPHC